jgi:peptidoglycan-N-acetylglucosamine deacetylase
MHPHIIGHRSRIRLLAALLDHIKSHAGVWFATHADVARYCLEAAPDVGAGAREDRR